MQTEKSQPSGQRIMPETRYPALSVYPRVGISLSASKTYDKFFLPIKINKLVFVVSADFLSTGLFLLR